MENSVLRTAKRAANSPVRLLDAVGKQGVFYSGVARSGPSTLLRYKKEILRLLAEYGLGAAGLALIGGSAVVVASISFFAGGVVASQGFTSLQNVGVATLSPLLGAFATIRLTVPVLGGIGLAVTLGAATTSELGAMRISEEIDALEVMSVRPMRYLVTTRVIAAMIVVTPLYIFAALTGFLANYLFLVLSYGVALGSFAHYFFLYLHPLDIVFSYIQILVMTIFLMGVHTYYGYNASGGPAGVGEAVGRSVRASLSGVMIVNLMVSLVLYSNFDTYHLGS